MVDRVQFSPSVGNKNLSELAATRRSEQAVISTTSGPGAVSGAPQAPELEPEVVESDAAKDSRLSPAQTAEELQKDSLTSPAESAAEQQKKLNSLTPAVRKAVEEMPDTQELVREAVGQFIEKSKPEPIAGGSGEAYVPEIDMPGSGGSGTEPVQSAPAPEVPKTAPPPAVEGDSSGGDADGPRGEVVDVVS